MVSQQIVTYSDMAKIIAPQLRLARVNAGFTQSQLAAHLGIKQSQVSAVENGTRDTTTDILERWADACNVIVKIEPAGDQTIHRLTDVLLSVPESERQKILRFAHALAQAPSDAGSGVEGVLLVMEAMGRYRSQ